MATSGFSFLLGGAKLPSSVQVVTLEISHGINKVPEARVVLRNSGPGRVEKVARPGASVSLRYGRGPGALTFKGEVVRHHLRVQDKYIEYELLVRHSLQRLQLNRHSRLFAAHSTEQQVLAQVLRPSSAHFELDDSLKHVQMVQFDCSDWQFLLARLRANGAWLLVDGDNIVIKRPQLGGAQHTFKGQGKGEGLVERMDWKFSNTSLTHATQATGWNMVQQQSEMSRGAKADIGTGALAAPSPASESGSFEMTHSLPLPGSELHELSSGYLLGQRAAAVQGNIVVQGDGKYALGQTIAFQDFGEAIDGKALISAVTHVIKAQAGAELAWRTTLSIGHVDWRAIQAPPVPTASGLHIGKVTAFPDPQASAEQADLIQVNLPVLGEHALLWARFASPSASANSGQCLYPDIGDEVVLGFFEDDPRYPIILGAMFNPHSKAPFAPGSAQKGWVFEHEGARQALLFNFKDHALTLESQNAESACVSINSSGEVAIAAQTRVQVAAQQTLELEGKSGVRVKGSRIDLNT